MKLYWLASVKLILMTSCDTDDLEDAMVQMRYPEGEIKGLGIKMEDQISETKDKWRILGRNEESD